MLFVVNKSLNSSFWTLRVIVFGKYVFFYDYFDKTALYIKDKLLLL